LTGLPECGCRSAEGMNSKSKEGKINTEDSNRNFSETTEIMRHSSRCHINHHEFQRSIIMRYFLFLFGTLLVTVSSQAQLSISIGFNIDRQPVWGPAGYDQVEYYYLPDIEVYYSVTNRRFYYFERGQWIGRSSLPARYRSVNLYTSYKVVVNEPNPYRNHTVYREKYLSYKGRRDQQAIRDSRDSKYFVNKNHPEHNKWKKEQQQGNKNGNKSNNDTKRGKKR